MALRHVGLGDLWRSPPSLGMQADLGAPRTDPVKRTEIGVSSEVEELQRGI